MSAAGLCTLECVEAAEVADLRNQADDGDRGHVAHCLQACKTLATDSKRQPAIKPCSAFVNLSTRSSANFGEGLLPTRPPCPHTQQTVTISRAVS